MNSNRTISAAVLLTFFIYSLFCLYPFENNLLNETAGIDDWNRYARFALDIKHKGLSIPSMQSDYFAPAAFLYNYFLAFCFMLFGENTVPVYILQNLMLGVSVLLVYFSFKDKLRRSISLLFLFTLILFAFIDIGKYYTFRFLSENLSIFLLSLFIFCLRKKEKAVYLYASGLVLGLSVLSRPNVLLFAFLFFALLIYYRYTGKIKTKIFPVLLLFLLVFSLLAFRNFYVTGNFTFLPAEGLLFAKNSFHDFSFILLIKKVLFCLGILSPLDPALNIRPHWCLMWIFYFGYLFMKWRSKEKTEFNGIILHLLIVSYFGSLIFMAPVINSYGFRLVLPAILFVLPFGFLAVENYRHKKKSSFLH
jgi:4-amino-4-deoxy-L-arabinose transferase-like glycosyltransferase